jgi:peptide/nickel transport system ATP-binding protein
MTPLLEIKGLQTHIRMKQGVVRAVDGVSLSVAAGETLGVVGESGCGKTMTALSVMNLLPVGGHIVGGSIKLNGQEISRISDEDMRRIRGNEIGMIFQDPLTSLNPTLTVGRQIAEAVLLHQEVTRKHAYDRAAEVLDLVGLPKARERIGEYPHQFSGGMRQRVMIAMALACEPKLLIADEPTTALDVTIQKQILELIDDLRQRLSMSMILVTHDLGVIAGRADRVVVMYAGKIAETAGTVALFANPRHPYTEALFESLPDQAARSRQRLYSIPGRPPDLINPPTGCRFMPRCRFAQDRCLDEEPRLTGATSGHQFACFFPLGSTARIGGDRLGQAEPPETVPATSSEAGRLLAAEHLVKDFPVTSGAMLRRRVGSVSAVADVSLSIRPGETFGLVGESGCGKTTIGRLIVGLEIPTAGTISFRGADITRSRGRSYRRQRRNIQYMFQDSYASLDPRMRVGTILREPLAAQRIGPRREQDRRIGEMLDHVGLPRSAVERYPHEFSGGQRQRLGFARALILQPQLIVADEPVSALDVSIQAQVLNLMRDLQRELGLTYLLVSHDLAVVRYLADDIGVMYLGKLVEVGPAEEVYLRAAHPYTQGLIDSAPVADPDAERAKARSGVTGEVPSAIRPPSGCRFRTRCPHAQDMCAEAEPPLRPFGPDGHLAACYFPLREPAAAAVREGASLRGDSLIGEPEQGGGVRPPGPPAVRDGLGLAWRDRVTGGVRQSAQQPGAGGGEGIALAEAHGQVPGSLGAQGADLRHRPGEQVEPASAIAGRSGGLRERMHGSDSGFAEAEPAQVGLGQRRRRREGVGEAECAQARDRGSASLDDPPHQGRRNTRIGLSGGYDALDSGFEHIPGAGRPDTRPVPDQGSDERVRGEIAVRGVGIGVEIEDAAGALDDVDQARPVRQVRLEHEMLRTAGPEFQDTRVTVDDDGPAIALRGRVLNPGDAAGLHIPEHRGPVERRLEGNPQGDAAVGHEPVADPAPGAQFAGGGAEHLTAGPVELPDAAESRGKSGIGDGQVSVIEQPARKVQPGRSGELIRSQAQALHEQPAQVTAGDAETGTQPVLAGVIQGPVDNEPDRVADQFRGGLIGHRGMRPVRTAAQAGPETRRLSGGGQGELANVAAVGTASATRPAVDAGRDDRVEVPHIPIMMRGRGPSQTDPDKRTRNPAPPGLVSTPEATAIASSRPRARPCSYAASNPAWPSAPRAASRTPGASRLPSSKASRMV